MKPPVCIGCQVEMKITQTGDYILEWAGGTQNPRPYRLTACDVYQCNSCLRQVAVNYASVSVYDHDEAFISDLRYAFKNRKLIHVFENLAQKNMLYATAGNSIFEIIRKMVNENINKEIFDQAAKAGAEKLDKEITEVRRIQGSNDREHWHDVDPNTLDKEITE